jgi:two-component system, sensor histidine kinase and response regulator
LVVDDNETSARMMSDHLQAWRMRCEIVGSMGLALTALKQASAAGDPFRVSIIDLQLPAPGGLDLAGAIKDMPDQEDVRLLGLYALGSRPEPTVSRAVGISALLRKPVRQNELFDTLNALMAGSAGSSLEPARRGPLVSEIKSVIPADIRRRTRILLVEDNRVNQQVEMRMIDRIGYCVVPVDNGRIALEKLSQTDFDIILMDCQMPEVDGYMATREIRRREGSTRHTPIIGVTAHALPGDRGRCLHAGMDDYIAKPIMPEDLAVIIDKWVAFINLPCPVMNVNAEVQAPRGT